MLERILPNRPEKAPLVAEGVDEEQRVLVEKGSNLLQRQRCGRAEKPPDLPAKLFVLQQERSELFLETFGFLRGRPGAQKGDAPVLLGPDLRAEPPLAGEKLRRRFADRTSGRQRLAIVADGALLLVPFAALPIPGEAAPLLVKHEVVSLPSVSVLASLRERHGRTPPPGLLAVVADPVFGPEDPRLDPGGDTGTTIEDRELTRSADDFGVDGFDRLLYSGAEAKALLALAGDAPSFHALDFDANRTVVTSGALRGYRIVHFATHGLLNTRHPSLSGLVLALVDVDANHHRPLVGENHGKEDSEGRGTPPRWTQTKP